MPAGPLLSVFTPMIYCDVNFYEVIKSIISMGQQATVARIIAQLLCNLDQTIYILFSFLHKNIDTTL